MPFHFFPELVRPRGTGVKILIVIVSMTTRFEEDMRQDDQSPRLPETDGGEPENCRHKPIPEQHDNPPEQKGYEYPEDNAAKHHHNYSNNSLNHDTLLSFFVQHSFYFLQLFP
jgi:hypothetical protein